MDLTDITLYNNNGVELQFRENLSSNEVKIKYDGLLAKEGANEVYLHAGLVDDTKYATKPWEQIRDIKMHKINGSGFETTVQFNKQGQTLAFAFKDSSQNWDNNSGKNYFVDTDYVTDVDTDY